MTVTTTRTPVAEKPHWLFDDPSRMRSYPAVVLGVWVVMYALYVTIVVRGNGVDPGGTPWGGDFIAFAGAAQHVWTTGDLLGVWDWEVLFGTQVQIVPGIDSRIAWFYPPTYLLAVLPLGLLPYPVAFAVWTAAGVGVWLVVLRLNGADLRSHWPLVAGFSGFWLVLITGQNSFFTAALAGAAMWAYGRGHKTTSGVLLGLFILKPHLALVFGLGLLAARQWRVIVAACTTAVTLFGVSVLILGVDTVPVWLHAMGLASDAVTTGGLPWFRMPTAFAALRLFGVSAEVAYAVHWLLAAAAAAAVWMVWSTRDVPWRLAASAAVIGTFLVSPYNYDYDLVWLAFPIVWLAQEAARTGWLPGERWMLAGLWVLPIMVAFPAVLTDHQFLGPPVLAVALWMVWRRARAVPAQVVPAR